MPMQFLDKFLCCLQEAKLISVVFKYDDMRVCECIEFTKHPKSASLLYTLHLPFFYLILD